MSTELFYRFIIYSRRSKVRKDGRQHTHETAEWQVNQYLKSLDAKGIKYEIVDHIAEDISGYGYYTKRPLFTEIVRRCKEDRSLTLLASKADRICRDVWTGAELLKTINLTVATDPNAEDMMLQMLFTVAEKEVRMQSDRRKAVYQSKKDYCIKTGEKLNWGAASPIYQANRAAGLHKTPKIRDTSHIKEIKLPVVNEIKKIISISKNSCTQNEIAVHLNASGFTTTTGKPHTKVTVSKLCKEFGIERKRLNKHITGNV